MAKREDEAGATGGLARNGAASTTARRIGADDTAAKDVRMDGDRALRSEEPGGAKAPTPVDKTAQATQAAAAPSKSRGGKAKFVVLALLLAAGAYGAMVGQEWWTHGRFLVTTDDAYVAADITTLAAKVTGYVASVEVVANQSVKAGDVIARLDDGDYRLALQSAENKIASQGATLQRIDRQIAAAQASVTQADAQVAAAQAELNAASASFERASSLVASKVSSQSTLDDARAARDKAEASHTAAKASVAAADANVGVLQAQKVEAEHALAELNTAREKAERDLSFTVIKAPVDGVVGNRAVEVGAYVQPGQRLAALVPVSAVYIDANFKETQLAEVKPGMKAEVTVDALGGERVLEGTVASFAPATGSVFSLLPPENATGNFTKIVQRVPVRVTLPKDVEDEGLLRPGLSVVVGVDTRTGR